MYFFFIPTGGFGPFFIVGGLVLLGIGGGLRCYVRKADARIFP